MKKVKIGVVGAARGTSMIKYSAEANNTELVAICDIREDLLNKHREKYPDKEIAYYTDFETFLNHDMDAVVLANYANEHAPFAIRCMKAGKHVFSEVLPVQTMKEAVELIECVEQTGKIYAYGENYCYMPAPYEMRRLYREGKIGEFEYGEGEGRCAGHYGERTTAVAGRADHAAGRGCETGYGADGSKLLLPCLGRRAVDRYDRHQW